MRRAKPRNTHLVERVYKSLWHLALAAIGAYEYRRHTTKVGKVLAVGMVAFHVDAAIADALDQRPMAKRLLDVALEKR